MGPVQDHKPWLMRPSALREISTWAKVGFPERIQLGLTETGAKGASSAVADGGGAVVRYRPVSTTRKAPEVTMMPTIAAINARFTGPM